MSNTFFAFVTLQETSKVDRIVGALVSKNWSVGPGGSNLIHGTSPTILSLSIKVPNSTDTKQLECRVIVDEIHSTINKLGTNHISIVVYNLNAASAWKAGSLELARKSNIANLKLVTPET